jgi:hypothetical protein
MFGEELEAQAEPLSHYWKFKDLQIHSLRETGWWLITYSLFNTRAVMAMKG